MAQSRPQNTVIIGAGLAGLSLALALNQQSISCSVYELRSPSFKEGGAIMLSPNALRILDDLGVYERIRSKGFSFDALTFKNESGETAGRYFFGYEKLYGYQGLRIYRQVLIDELLKMLQERNILIHYNKKFSKIVSESGNEVCFEFADGSTENANLLIGADGIDSSWSNLDEDNPSRRRCIWRDLLQKQDLYKIFEPLRPGVDLQTILENEEKDGKGGLWKQWLYDSAVWLADDIFTYYISQGKLGEEVPRVVFDRYKRNRAIPQFQYVPSSLEALPTKGNFKFL